MDGREDDENMVSGKESKRKDLLFAKKAEGFILAGILGVGGTVRPGNGGA